LESKAKKRGSEKMNSMREKIKVTHLIALPFSLLMKRRTMAPNIGKKISSDRMGIPKMVMKPAPLLCAATDLVENSTHDIIGYKDDSTNDH
jgi:hypothetical protein